MNGSSKALASLTAQYTDSENSDNEDDVMEEVKEQEIEEEPNGDEEMEEQMDEIEETSDDDGLPPEPTAPCPKALQDKFNNLFEKAKQGSYDMNKQIQSNKSFRNPSIYEKLIDYCDVNEFGTNYPPQIYDPFKWGKESYYDELAKIQKLEMEKREKGKKSKVSKVEIVSGTAKKISAANGNVNSNNSSVTSSGADGEKRRKTKWDQASSSSNR